MSSSVDVRKKIADIATKRAAIERQASDASRRQSAKHTESAKRTEQAAKASADSARRSYQRQAATAQTAALAEGRKIADLSQKLAALAKDEGTQQKSLGDAIKRETADQTAKAKKNQQTEERRRTEERTADERRAAHHRRQDQHRQERARAEDRSHVQSLVGSAEERLSEQIQEATRAPKKEQLRILYATANSGGDLVRVDEEIRRVRAAVQASTHRDQVDIQHLPATTSDDLISGLMSFRPHVVHFSGHSDETAIVFDTGSPQHGPGNAVTADAFKAAVESPDEPPRVVVLNSCKSAAQLQSLLGKVAIAIGMSDSVHDLDAITFATRFYATLAEGQSVSAAHAAARANMRMNGLPDHGLPTLEAIPGVDPGQVLLVAAPD